MELYLSSHMLGCHADRLLAAAGGRGARMAVITNALDYIPLEAQLEYTRTHFDPIAYFSQNGFDPSPLDLRFYFDRPATLRERLLRHRVVWAVGGNAFLLRKAMRESGFDEVIQNLSGEDIIYAGWSAGACVAGDSLRAISFMDDPEVTAPGYTRGEPIWEGLALVPFTIIPHFESDHPEAASAAKAVRWAMEHGVEHRALRDGEVLATVGGKPTHLLRPK